MTVAGIILLGFAMNWNVIFYSSPTVIGVDLDRVGPWLWRSILVKTYLLASHQIFYIMVKCQLNIVRLSLDFLNNEKQDERNPLFQGD